MAQTIAELETLLVGIGTQPIRKDESTLLVGCKTDQYTDAEGVKGLLIVVQLSEEGRYVKIFAPQAFKISGQHTETFLRACAILQWRTKLVQFEYDESDGEVRPMIEIAIEDSKLTDKQMRRCLFTLAAVVDKYYPVLKKAVEEGKIQFTDNTEERKRAIQMLESLLAELQQEEDAETAQQPPERL
jgi:hypothetical protein